MRVLTPANVNAYLNRFSVVLNWAVKEDLIARNPARGLRVADEVDARDKRHPFSPSQLRKIFDAPLYRGCKDDRNGYAIVGPNRPRRARFWVPLIALFSGMRLNEICQLEANDVREFDGVLCFVITSLSTPAADGPKRLKTAASERIVPVHSILLDLGFGRFVEERKRSDEASMFPEVPLSPTGYRSTSFSKWFSRFLHFAEATSPKTCFHSFRHNFRDALREAQVEREVALALGGWTTSAGGSAVADTYGKGFRAVRLKRIHPPRAAG